MPTPLNRSSSGRYANWNHLIRRAQKRPGQWILAFIDTPASTVESIRRRRAPALRALFGKLEPEGRNRHRVDGQDRIDLYVRYVPPKETDERP